MLMGQRGGAEYELLSGIEGSSFSYLQNTLTISAVMILILVVANVRYAMTRESSVTEET
jgi:hypothetical protein